jgi:hypothetical protein
MLDLRRTADAVAAHTDSRPASRCGTPLIGTLGRRPSDAEHAPAMMTSGGMARGLKRSTSRPAKKSQANVVAAIAVHSNAPFTMPR